MVASPRQTPFQIWTQDGLPATVRRPNGLQAFLDAPSPSHHQFLKANGSMPGQETRGPCSRILEWVPTCAAAWSDVSRGSASSLQTQSQCGTTRPHHLVSKSQFPHPQNEGLDTLCPS